MRINKRYIMFVAGLLLTFVGCWGQMVDGKHLRISLITCTPGVDVYSHFGHTAIQVEDDSLGRMIVFNYGCFDYSEDNFVLKFIKGDTNYKLDAEPQDFFLWRYNQDGMGVDEQILNLTDVEKERLFELLLVNIRPENQTYLYNWLYDNCTERARDVIEKAVNGRVEYRKHMTPITVRQMLHGCLENNKWLTFGIDLMLGTEIDEFASQRLQMFLPAYFEAEVDEAVIVDKDGNVRPLVKTKRNILKEKERTEGDFPISPEITIYILCAISIALYFIDRRRVKENKRRLSIWMDAPLLVIQGTAGCIVAFLFFFSIHPAVDSNWWVIALNPLPLLYAPYLIWCDVKGKKDFMAYIYVPMMLAFIAATIFAKQDFSASLYWLPLLFFTRCMNRSKLNDNKAISNITK